VDLDDDEYMVREGATQELARYSEAARPLLRAALAEGKLSPEAASRVRRLLGRLDGIEPPAEELREARAVQLLEGIATPDARAHLEPLARGQAGSPLTEEAAHALRRLEQRAK